MKNRIASLFELDELLGTGGNGHSGTRAPQKRKVPRNTTAAPRDASPVYRSVKRKSRSVDRHVDKGDPIRCEHAVPYKPVPPVDVQEPPLPPAVPPPAAQQLGEDEYDVEAFEEPDEDLPLSLPDIEEETLDSDDDDTAIEQSYLVPEPPSASVASYAYQQPETFAAQMSAVEQDLADLASRVSPQPSDATAPDTAQQDGEPDPSPAPPNPTSGHGVFDQMAQGMAYATEFRLPAVQLSQVFSALDKQLDSEERQKQVGSQPPAPTVQRQAPASGPTPSGSGAPIPDNVTLINDLVAMPCTPTTSPSPAGASPVAEVNKHESSEPGVGTPA